MEKLFFIMIIFIFFSKGDEKNNEFTNMGIF